MKTSPKDIFLHLLAIATLYISAFSLGSLMFQYVDYFFADRLAPYVETDAIRFALASLIIIFPAHIFAARLLHKDFLANPEKRNFSLRKWLLYLTLFLAAIALIIDAVALVYNFLSGGLTSQFLLKALAIAAIAGGIFRYYLWELKRPEPQISPRAKSLLSASAIFVALAVIGGFFLVGSPFQQRLIKFDRARVSDLTNIQGSILSYWQSKDHLPANLDELRDEFSGFIPPTDPATKAPYEYQPKSDLSFEICAVFSAASADDPQFRFDQNGIAAKPYPFADQQTFPVFSHGKGKMCFLRTIDPEKYRLNKELLKPLPRADVAE